MHMHAAGAFLVPTLVTYFAIDEMGQALGFPARSLAKVHDVLEAGFRSLELARDAGVEIARSGDGRSADPSEGGDQYERCERQADPGREAEAGGDEARDDGDDPDQRGVGKLRTDVVEVVAARGHRG